MSGHDDVEIDAHSGRTTTGHEWDGIKELDTPLPRWWLYIFYATIAISIVYWVLMPAWPLANGYTKGVLNQSDRRDVMADLSTLNQGRAANYQKLLATPYSDVLTDPALREFAFSAGQAVFGDNCGTCHGANGAGAPGFPALGDDVWIWGGSFADIEQTIKYGVRSGHPETRMSQMPAYGRDQLLTKEQIGDVAEYVLTLGPAAKRENPNASVAARGAAIFAEQCTVCHGVDGGGNRMLGAPSLKDDIWLYGGSRSEVRKQIELGRAGVMPNWDQRFDPAVIRALAIYVHGLGGGEADPPVVPAADAAPPSPATP